MFSCQKRHCFYIVCKLRLLYSLYLVNKDIRESYCCLCNWFSTTIHHHSKCRMNLILLSMPVKLGAIYDKFLVYTSICWYFSFVTKRHIWNLANNLLLLYPISVWSVCCPRATVKICNLKDKNSNPKQHLKTILLITHKNKSQWNAYLKQGF